MYFDVRFKMLPFLIISTLATFTTVTALPINNSSRIVGGSDAPEGAYPFLVSIRRNPDVHFCGGTILSNLNILTAAHCLIGQTIANTFVVVGTNTINSGGVIRWASRLIIHPNYSPNFDRSDIGVLVLSEALAFNHFINSITIHSPIVTLTTAVMVGWGRTSTGGSLSNYLQHLNTETITNDECRLTWGGRITGTNICSLNQESQGICNGDSGGPLIDSGSGEQIGIISFMRPCAQGVPDVHTRVSSFTVWLSHLT